MDGPDVCGGSSASVRTSAVLRLMDGPDVCGGSSASVRSLGRSPSDGRSRCLWRFVCVSEEPQPFSV